MQRRTFLAGAGLLLGVLGTLGGTPARADEALVVIAHAPLPGLDAEALRRIYTGRVIELGGQVLQPVNRAPGSPLRQRFLGAVLQQTDADYVAYWTVRRYIGKGAPPRELSSGADVFDFVRRTPGAIGYIDAAELRPGVYVVTRR
jgi:ABC-type phosphate transport system substrate-binding protein